MGAAVAVRGGLDRAQARLIAHGGRRTTRRLELPGYSPITLQMKPIEMKKPENRAISPMPP
jgi:hypothetical protein